jgi:hypothetical protein
VPDQPKPPEQRPGQPTPTQAASDLNKPKPDDRDKDHDQAKPNGQATRDPNQADPNPDKDRPRPTMSGPTSGPKTGEIVLVRQDIQHVIPGIVVNDYAGQNTSGVIAVVTFTTAPYGGTPVNLVPNCQPEDKDTPAEDLVATYQGYYMPLDSNLRERDLQKEIDDHKDEQRDKMREQSKAQENKPAP